MDKRHWPEFGIIKMFFWTRGTVLSLVLLYNVFVDKRHWPEFGIIKMFFWTRGTVLSLVLLYNVFVDKRHWPEFGIIKMFFWTRGTVLSLVLLQCFVDKRHWPEFGIVTIFFADKRHWPTGLHWYCYHMFVEAFCHVRAEVFFGACDYFGGSYFVISLFFSLQMSVLDHGWRCLLLSV